MISPLTATIILFILATMIAFIRNSLLPFMITAIASIIGVIGFTEMETYRSKIVDIGGCNREYCGVRLENGAIASERSPVIGEEVTYRVEWRWKDATK